MFFYKWHLVIRVGEFKQFALVANSHLLAIKLDSTDTQCGCEFPS